MGFPEFTEGSQPAEAINPLGNWLLSVSLMFVVHQGPGRSYGPQWSLNGGLYAHPPGGVCFQDQLLGDGCNLQLMRLERRSLILCLSTGVTVAQVCFHFFAIVQTSSRIVGTTTMSMQRK